MNPYDPPRQATEFPKHMLPAPLRPQNALSGARGLLLILGIFRFTLAGIAMLYARDLVAPSLRAAGHFAYSSDEWTARVDEGARVLRTFAFVDLAIACIYLLGGWLVCRFPMICTVTSMAVYLLTTAATLMFSGGLALFSIWFWVITILTLVGLAAAVREALQYKKQLRLFLDNARR